MYVDLEVMDRFEELECIISNASSIPFSHKSGIDKEEVLELINNIKASLPEELKQAHWVNQERHKIINDSKQEALEIVEQAKKEASGSILDKSYKCNNAVNNSCICTCNGAINYW